MLYHLLFPLADHFIAFNLFRYITFRTGGAVMTALFLSFVLGPRLIRWLRLKQKGGQPIRMDGPESHLLTKQGTPTMGGVLILLALAIATLLWADLRNVYVWVVLLVTLGYGGIGFLDDYLKVTRRSSGGLPGRLKLLGQAVIGLIAAVIIVIHMAEPLATSLALPLFKDLLIPLGLFFPFVAAFVMVGSSNAVNLTDGLDGLAIVPVMIAAACSGLIAFLVGNIIFSGISASLTSPARASSPCSAVRWSAPLWAFSGSMRRQPWSSWGIPARSPPVAPWVPPPSSSSTSSSSPL
jgi:phospho-N-acetylmuramoyl-pentapeptide-transferase